MTNHRPHADRIESYYDTKQCTRYVNPIARYVYRLVACGTIMCCMSTCQTSKRSTRADCETIINRIIDIELKEIGYNDPLLGQKKKAAFKKTHAAQIDACIGKRLSKRAMTCIRTAQTTEALSHDCLR